MKPLVSVIVPMYSVEKYIVKCIDSIVAQSYKNIEIILVDDGSPDNSGSIADEHAKLDKRIKVIHKINGGVSAARNDGIVRSKGKYISFIDGDDWVAPDYIEYLLKIALDTSTDMAMSVNMFYTSKRMVQVENDKIEVYSAEKATAELLYPRITVGSCNKIFKKSFIKENNLRFKTEIFMGEGLDFITTASQRANSVGVGRRKVYIYRQDNAESATTKIDIRNDKNLLDNINNIKNNLIIRTPEVEMAMRWHTWITAFYTMRRIISTSAEQKHALLYKDVSRYVHRHALGMLQARISFLIKLKVLLIWLFPRPTSKLINRAKRRNLKRVYKEPSEQQ